MAPVLAARNHLVNVVLQDHPDNRAAFEGLSGVTLYFFPACGAIAERRTKSRILGSLQPDITHVCGLGWRNLVRRPPRGLALLMDHVELESAIAGSGSVRRMLQRILEWWSLREHDGHVAASRFLESWAANGVGRRNTVLYLPYAHDRPRVSHHSEGDWHARFSGRSIVLYSGGWWSNYGFYESLQAAELLAGMRSDFVLVLTGRGPEEAGGRRWIKERGLEDRIHFAGYLTAAELESLMESASVFLSPLNNTIQDRARCPSKVFLYMQHRRPIVIAAVGEGLEYFSDGQFRYSPGDFVQMARAIERALDVPRRWTPNYEAERHTWLERVEAWETWVNGNWGGHAANDRG